MNTKTARKQIRKLYLIDSVGSLMIAGASWVALLSARGFSTATIGFAESIFHIASMVFEVPSGAVADVFGRKKTMVASRAMAVLSAIMMIFSDSFLSIAITMVVSALSYNLASGTREAMAYDSLKEAGIEKEYDKFASNDLIVYQITSSLATLLAGAAIALGYKRAYAVDVLVGLLSIVIAASLTEVKMEISSEKSVKKRFKEVVEESVSFIKDNPKVRHIIFVNAFIGAVSILVLFFLQAKLPKMGIKEALFGPALFVMGLGAALGAKATTIIKSSGYRKVCVMSFSCVTFALAMSFSGNTILVILGGFIGAFGDNFIQVKADVMLNGMIPSEQRATLMSVNSFAFSVVMIILSPIFGALFML
ncbi:MAG: MFS transporter [Butyrivibrio sp.]|nr:MFS transporter [Butyrivibrio sp.]